MVTAGSSQLTAHGSRLLVVCALAVLAILLSSCAAPYFERAAMEPGFAWGAGVGVGGGSFASLRYDNDDPYMCAHVAPKATLYSRYNFTSRFGLFLQATTGAAYEISHFYDSGFGSRPSAWLLVEMADIELGAKVGLGRRDALRIGLGTVYLVAPVLANIVWLHDLDDSWTTNLGLGTRGLITGMGYHFPLADWATGHVSLTGAFLLRPSYWDATVEATGQIGFALEPRPRRTD